jgi:hypothetical protein
VVDAGGAYSHDDAAVHRHRISDLVYSKLARWPVGMEPYGAHIFRQTG